ncbi:MAG: Elp3 protein [Candidatus Magasanikbacteria bacterium]|nr:Elp3 protein [Candidatus Magasanikbacteria bacterium]
MAIVLLTENPSIYRRDDRAVVIFPSKPYWFSATSEISDILDAFKLGESAAISVRIAEILQVTAEEATDTYEDVSQLLFHSGVLAIDGQTSEMKTYSPHFQVAEVENVLVIAATNDCNMACPMCYAMASRKFPNEMTTDEIIGIVDQAARMPWEKGNGISRIALTGGELFTRPDALELIEYVHSRGFSVQVNSNATLITRDHINRLAVLPRLKMSISLDGSHPGTHELIRGFGNFKVTTDAVRALCENGVFVAINMFVHAGNIQEIKSTMMLADSLGATGFNCLNMMNVGRGNTKKTKESLIGVPLSAFYRAVFDAIRDDSHLQKLMSHSMFANQIMGIAGGVKSNSCGIGTNRAVYVKPDGSLYPCADTALPVFRLGNLRTENLGDIWENSPILKDLRALDIDTNNPRCSKCDVRYQCAGNCRGENYQTTGSMTRPHFKCREIHDSVIALMWILTEAPDLFQQKIEQFHNRVNDIHATMA